MPVLQRRLERDRDPGHRRRPASPPVCTACKRRFTTYEKLGAPGLKVHKRDGSLEPFDGEKLFHALQRVAAHRDNVTRR